MSIRWLIDEQETRGLLIDYLLITHWLHTLHIYYYAAADIY